MSCIQCGGEGGQLLHHVRLRGEFSQVCTDCFLRLHPRAFCPTCYLVFESESPIPNPSNDALVTCSNCYSSSHITCVGPAHSRPYICPLCTNPNSPMFVLQDAAGGGMKIGKRTARVWHAAAKIAAELMNKAVEEAKAEAIRRVQEAVLSSRKAVEAMEHLKAIIENELSDLESEN